MLLRRVCLFLLFAVAAVNLSFAQGGATGAISGTITDSSGAILPNIKVTVANTGTNADFNTVTNSAGDYSATSLSPGTYKVTAIVIGNTPLIKLNLGIGLSCVGVHCDAPFQHLSVSI